MSISTMDYVRGVEQASSIYAQALHEYSIENTKLERENEELKQLVRHMYTCMEHVDGFGVYYDCENCALKDECDKCGFEERVRAFGIEVD